jgi:hypothetical protein
MQNPGSITNSVPDPDRAIRLQRDVQRNAQEQASARSLQQSQIGAGGLLINDGGSLTIAGGGSVIVDGIVVQPQITRIGRTLQFPGTITAGVSVFSAPVVFTVPVGCSRVDITVVSTGQVRNTAAAATLLQVSARVAGVTNVGSGQTIPPTEPGNATGQGSASLVGLVAGATVTVDTQLDSTQTLTGLTQASTLATAVFSA